MGNLPWTLEKFEMAWLCSLEGLNEEYQNCHHPGRSKRLWCLHQGKRMKGERSSVTPCWGKHTYKKSLLSELYYSLQSKQQQSLWSHCTFCNCGRRTNFPGEKPNAAITQSLLSGKLSIRESPGPTFILMWGWHAVAICPKIMLRGEELHSFMLDTFNNLMVKLEGVKLYHVEIIR